MRGASTSNMLRSTRSAPKARTASGLLTSPRRGGRVQMVSAMRVRPSAARTLANSSRPVIFSRSEAWRSNIRRTLLTPSLFPHGLSPLARIGGIKGAPWG